MASHRIGARVAGLSPEQLCAIIEAQAGASDAALRVAEEHAARLVEQPEWVLSEVLLSPDLAPHILAQLPTKEHAAKGTCRAWRRGWKETLKKRERPRLLVIGGDDSDGEFVNSLERYDPSTNEWEEEAVAPMPTARTYVGTAVLDGKLYAVGGQSEADGATSNLVERYDLATKAWEAVAPMATARRLTPWRCSTASCTLWAATTTTTAPSARWSGTTRRERVGGGGADGDGAETHAVAVLDGKLYAVGGYNDDGSSARWSGTTRRRTRGRRWRRWRRRGMLTPWRCSTASCTLWAAYDDDGDLSSVERYDPAMDAWEAVAPMATARRLTPWRCSTASCTLWADRMPATTPQLGRAVRPGANAWEAVAPMATARAFPLALV